MKTGWSGSGLPHFESALVLQAAIEGMTPAQILARDQLITKGVSHQEANKAALEAMEAPSS